MSKSETVLVRIKSSVGVGGTMYHPNSNGVKMPLNHAKAIGAEIIKTEKPQQKDLPVDDESTKENPADDKSEHAEQEQEQSDKEPESLPEDLPVDDDVREKLLADDQFNTLDNLEKNQDTLTDVEGIGPATAKKIVEYLNS